jgi:hypothetical protein
VGKRNYRGYRSRRGNITAAIWLIGLGILALTDQWWPGILILIGLSMVVNAVMPAGERPPRPGADETKDHSYLEEPFPDADEPPPPPPPEPPLQVKVPDKKPAFSGDLPSHCPMCGAPVEASKVKRDPSGAPICAYCEASLNL